MSDQLLIAIIGSGALAGLINLINNLFLRRLERRDAIRTGMMTILFDRLRYLGNKYVESEEVDYDDLRNFHKMHDVYHQLGGNGDLDALKNRVDGLKLKKN